MLPYFCRRSKILSSKNPSHLRLRSDKYSVVAAVTNSSILLIGMVIEAIEAVTAEAVQAFYKDVGARVAAQNSLTIAS